MDDNFFSLGGSMDMCIHGGGRTVMEERLVALCP